MSAKINWLFEAIDRAEPFFRSESVEAQLFGFLIVLDKLPTEEPSVRILKSAAQAGAEAHLTNKRFDPVEFIVNLPDFDGSRSSDQVGPTQPPLSESRKKKVSKQKPKTKRAAGSRAKKQDGSSVGDKPSPPAAQTIYLEAELVNPFPLERK